MVRWVIGSILQVPFLLFELDRYFQVPFLSFGETFGKHIIRQEGESEMSGRFVVEDVEADHGITLRRLLFLSTDYIVQSESRLVKGWYLGVNRQYRASRRFIFQASYDVFEICQQLPVIIKYNMPVL